MSLRHAVLGLLELAPATGYELTRRFDRSLAHAWHASHSQIYPELAKLQEAGMVEIAEEGARRSRTWAITPAGREELRRFLVEADPNRAQRNETGLRWFLLLLLPPDDRRAALEREIAFIDAESAGLRTQAAEAARSDGPRPMAPTIDLGLRMQQVMREWLLEQRDAVSGG